MPFLTHFFGEGSPKIDYRKKGHPDSNLSTGGSSLVACSFGLPVGLLFGLKETSCGQVASEAPRMLVMFFAGVPVQTACHTRFD